MPAYEIRTKRGDDYRLHYVVADDEEAARDIVDSLELTAAQQTETPRYKITKVQEVA
jgi:hypothetical protein